jgi:hypothetical protein
MELKKLNKFSFGWMARIGTLTNSLYEQREIPASMVHGVMSLSERKFISFVYSLIRMTLNTDVVHTPGNLLQSSDRRNPWLCFADIKHQ